MRSFSLLLAAGLVVCAPGAQGAPTPQLPPIAFSSDRPDRDLVVMSADGSHRRIITANARDDVSPSWSPDGFHVAFSYYDRRGARIAVLDLRTGQSQELGAGWNPDWSPDGDRLVFVDAEGFNDLLTMSADGTDRRRLNLRASQIGVATDPAWSQDGRRIAFTGSGLYTVDPNGANVRKVSDGGAGRVTWSPDGTGLAFECGFFQVCRIGADGSRPSVIRQRGGSPAWSPSGELIAVTNGLPWPLTILVRPNGVDVRTLPKGGDHPDWSPDGRNLVAAVDRGGGLYSTDSNGTGLARVTLGPTDSAPAGPRMGGASLTVGISEIAAT